MLNYCFQLTLLCFIASELLKNIFKLELKSIMSPSKEELVAVQLGEFSHAWSSWAG